MGTIREDVPVFSLSNVLLVKTDMLKINKPP